MHAIFTEPGVRQYLFDDILPLEQAAQAALRHGVDVLRLRLMARLGFAPTGESDGPKYRARTYEVMRPLSSG